VRAQIKLGRIAGIAVGLHYSWFIIALLITFSLVGHFHSVTPQWTTAVVWASAIITCLLFFAALLLHELAHSLVAKAYGLRVQAITLFALGGVSQIETDVPDAKTEFWMAIAGPITSVVIGMACLGTDWMIGWLPGKAPTSPAVAVLLWLGYINLVLAAFNMIPGFPLDGGRILRAIIWWSTGNAEKSTMLAARTGQGVALLFIAFGVFRFFGGAGIGGLWIAFIGWFLLQAAGASYAQVALSARLKDVRVSDVMDRDCTTVDGHLNVQNFVEEHLLRTGRRCYVVAQNGHVEGLVTPHEIKAIERPRWPYTTLHDVMRPLDQLHTVTPLTPVMEALETMGRDDVNQLPVVEQNHLEGVVTRAHVLQFLQTRAELGQLGARG